MRERHGVLPAWITRLVAGTAAAALAMTASPAHAQDAEESTGEAVCQFHDSRLEGASGITAADGEGWWIVTDGTNQDSTLSVQRVGADCNPREAEEAWIEHQPRDPQALAVDTDGFLWVADTGDALNRDSIALNQINLDDLAGDAITRFVFPDGPEETSAFLILPEVDTPVFITAAEGEATLYGPSGEPMEYDTPLESLGTVALPDGGSVTGAALNADASKVVLRTADNAYEWTVEGGDVLAAITGAEPLATPLADQGEAEDITYDPDGNFITLSQFNEDGAFGSLTRYTPAAPPAEEPSEATGGDDAAADEGDGPSIVDRILDLGFETIVRILTVIAVIGFLVMLGGILAIRKSRRERAAADDDGTEMGFAREESVFGKDYDDPLPPDPVDLGLDAGQPDPEVGQLAQGAVYGAPKPEPSGNVYGAKRPESTGSVYGAKPAAEPSGNVYGAAAPDPAAGSVYRAPAPEPKPERTGSVYGAPRQEPQYGAFEAAGQGSVYNDVGGSFAVDPPPPPPPPAPREPTGGVYGAKPATPPGGAVYGGQSSSVESTGTVYGAGGRSNERTPEPDDDFWGPPEGGNYGRGR